mmetsp:Transcript_50712/g.144890  ORF Transcript_50712/g.144890 Transcript_50712/m.144890 type:complete len:247 (+) Transcript_50712:98-838(+)
MGCATSAAAGACAAEEVSVDLVHARVTRGGDAGVVLGLRVQLSDFHVIIQGVDEGSIIAQWNDEHPEATVSRGDIVRAVNGVRADGSWGNWCKLLEELRKGEIDICVARGMKMPFAWNATITSQPELDRLLPKDFVEQLPRVKGNDCNEPECIICLEELEGGAGAIQLPCGHVFHPHCADRWLSQCPTIQCARCPVCKRQVAVEKKTGPLRRDSVVEVAPPPQYPAKRQDMEKPDAQQLETVAALN